MLILEMEHKATGRCAGEGKRRAPAIGRGQKAKKERWCDGLLYRAQDRKTCGPLHFVSSGSSVTCRVLRGLTEL